MSDNMVNDRCRERGSSEMSGRVSDEFLLDYSTNSSVIRRQDDDMNDEREKFRAGMATRPLDVSRCLLDDDKNRPKMHIGTPIRVASFSHNAYAAKLTSITVRRIKLVRTFSQVG